MTSRRKVQLCQKDRKGDNEPDRCLCGREGKKWHTNKKERTTPQREKTKEHGTHGEEMTGKYGKKYL